MDFSNARLNMVQQQLKPWHVLNEKILSLIASVPRENFVPREYRSLAYIDTEIPLIHGQNMLSPKVVGRILQAVDLNGLENVLEIGTGTGYLTALLSKLSHKVITIEIHRDIADQAQVNLQYCNIKNTSIEITNGFNYVKEANYFDIIILTGSVTTLTSSICRQLATGGKIFAIVGKQPIMYATVYTKINTNSWSQQKLFETVVSPLQTIPSKEEFIF